MIRKKDQSISRSKGIVILRKRILFCVMVILAVARFARKILPKEVKIFSAGLEPKGIHPMVTIKTFILSIGL